MISPFRDPSMTRPVLYDYYRSSAAYRVRIALNMKGIDYDRVPVNLVEGAQKEAEYRARNPQGFVPMLEMGGMRLTQSLAIIDWLDTAAPEPRLIPADPARSEEHTSELQSLMRISYAVFCLKKKNKHHITPPTFTHISSIDN